MDKLAAMHTFIRVVEAGTFTRAAETLDLPKSSVTRLIQSLEKEVGVKLLHRTTRQLTVTQEGAAYYEGALAVLEQIGQLDTDVAGTARTPKGTIRIEAPGAVAYNILLPALPDFFARYPDVQVDLGIGNRSIDLIAERIDCVLRLGALLNEALIARPLAPLSMVTCASAAYVAAHGAPRHPHDLRGGGHKLINIVAPRTGRRFTDTLTRAGESIVIDGQQRIAVNDSTAALVAALAGLGVTTTYRFLAQPHLDSGALRQLLPDWDNETVAAHVAYAANRHLPSKVRVFVDWVGMVFQGLAEK
jgi:DNA-binding transcriptional LysR family regulator